jgi:hypothetical protein
MITGHGPSVPQASTITSVARSFWREGRQLVLRIVGVLGTRVLIAVCLLLAVSTAMSAWLSLSFAARGAVVDGVVVRQEEELLADWRGADASRADGLRMTSAQRVFRAVIEFKVGERTYQVFSQQRGPDDVYPLGSKQAVVVPPGRPAHARIRAELPDFWTQAGLLLMSTVIGAATLRWWWSMARRPRRFRRRPQPPTPPDARS